MPVFAEAWMRKSESILKQEKGVKIVRKKQVLVDYANALLIIDWQAEKAAASAREARAAAATERKAERDAALASGRKLRLQLKPAQHPTSLKALAERPGLLPGLGLVHSAVVVPPGKKIADAAQALAPAADEGEEAHSVTSQAEHAAEETVAVERELTRAVTQGHMDMLHVLPAATPVEAA